MVSEDTVVPTIAKLPLDVLWKAACQHAIISIADSAGTIVYANELFCRISGYQVEELVGRNHRIVKSSAHPTSFYADMWRTICAGGVWQGEVCNCHKSGSLYWVRATIVPILDSNQLPTHYASFRTDITHEKQQLEVMRRLEHAEAELLRLAPFGIARLRDRVIIKANDEFHHLLGYASGELIGKTTRAIYHSDEQFSTSGQMAYEPLVRGEHVKYEDKLRRKDGASLYVIAGTCSLSRDAPISDTLYIIQDITPHKELEEELANLARKNEAISHSKSEFMAIVAHELKTPLHGILGTAQLFELTPGVAEVELTHELHSSAKRLMRVIDEVIQFTSYDLHEVAAGEVMNLKTLVFITAERYELRARQTGIGFDLAIADALDVEFIVDAKCLGKIIAIVLDNAVKFTHQGHIQVGAAISELSDEHALLHIVVTDTGIGMSDRITANPFAPFQQDDNSLNRRYDGLGLGLALAKKLIDRLEGSIALSSALNQGTHVEISIPVLRASPEQ